MVATCGGADKAALLRELGVDRVIDYRKETVKEVSQQKNSLPALLRPQFVDNFMNDLTLPSCVVPGLEEGIPKGSQRDLRISWRTDVRHLHESFGSVRPHGSHWHDLTVHGRRGRLLEASNLSWTLRAAVMEVTNSGTYWTPDTKVVNDKNIIINKLTLWVETGVLQSGFFLVQYAKMYQEHIGKLYNLYSSGKLKVTHLHTLLKGSMWRTEYDVPKLSICDWLADFDRPKEVRGSPFGG